MTEYSLTPVNNAKFERDILNLMADELNMLGDTIEPVIDRNTPTNTKTLIGNTRRSRATINTMQVTFVNDTPYAIYVEGLDGNGNRTVTTVKDFHKGPPRNESTKFYTGPGVGFMSRSFDEVLANYK